jgi:hypothetical protein
MSSATSAATVVLVPIAALLLSLGAGRTPGGATIAIAVGCRRAGGRLALASSVHRFGARGRGRRRGPLRRGWCGVARLNHTWWAFPGSLAFRVEVGVWLEAGFARVFLAGRAAGTTVGASAFWHAGS